MFELKPSNLRIRFNTLNEEVPNTHKFRPMVRLMPALSGRKEQLTLVINLIFIVTGVIFVIHDYFADYRVDGYWSPGSIREVELIIVGALVILLLRFSFLRVAKLITSLSLIIIFFVSPLFIELNYLEMYYINTLLLPVIVLIPSLVYTAKEDGKAILALFIVSLLTNFACEVIIFRTKNVSPSDLIFYEYHFLLFSMAKIFTSVFIYLNVTRLFRQNEVFEEQVVLANKELHEGNQLIQQQNRQIEEQNLALRSNAEQLKKMDEVKSHFFTNISHEFRTPLTLLLGPLGEEIEQAKDSVSREKFLVMKRNAARLLNLVNQLLDLSKLESGSLKLKASYGDLGTFLKQLASQFESVAEVRRIEFSAATPETLFGWFDSDKVEKMVTNLLANAFKFTPPGGVVSLAARPVESPGNGLSRVEIEVSDSGVGIEEDKLERIFDRFYQVSDSSRREYEGTGIGLALTKELVQVHHGSISVFSQPGQGTIFTIKLPIADVEFTRDEMVEQPPDVLVTNEDLVSLTYARVNPEAPASHSVEKPHILVVEDNADLRDYLSSSLSTEYKVTCAHNGQEGIDLTRSELPDLVVSDLMMPKVDGLELLRRLKLDEKTSHVPIILLTAKADAATRLEGFESGADDYVAKPFDAAELKARIHNIIDNRRKLREKFSVASIIRPNEITVNSLDDQFLKKVLLSIEAHLADDLFGVSELADDVAMSTVQLYRKVKALSGKTPNDLIRTLRLDRAKSLLEQKAGNISDVAVQTGFRNMSYFAKCFREKFGVNPSEV